MESTLLAVNVLFETFTGDLIRSDVLCVGVYVCVTLSAVLQ